MNLNKYIIYIFFLLSILFTGCSTTKNLPKGEVLYIGVKEMKVDNPENYEITPEVKSQVEKALSVAPNNSFFGSCYTRLPFPFGLWIYNSFKTDKKKGLKHWIFEKLAANPVLISDVDPSLRAKVAETLMNDNGYFDGSVKYEIIPDKKDDRKAKIEYIIDYNHPFTYSTIEYIKTNIPADSLIEELQKNSLLKENEIFNVNTLEDERSRISNYLRSKGYYYFRPDFITYMADSTLVPYKIALRLLVNNNLPVQMTKPWKIGDIGYSINNSYGRVPNDTIFYKDIRISYRNKKPMRSKVLYKSLDLHKGDTYSPEIVTQTQTQLNKIGRAHV